MWVIKSAIALSLTRVSKKTLNALFLRNYHACRNCNRHCHSLWTKKTGSEDKLENYLSAKKDFPVKDDLKD
jgi:hypothetical protein